MKSTIRLFFLTLIVFVSITVQAQRKTEIGLTGGAIRFYPIETQAFLSNLNNSMDNGWGFSVGLFIEEHWKPKIHQFVEITYNNLSSDVFLQKNPNPPWSPYDGTGRQPIYGDFTNSSFDNIAISGGIKYFLNKTLFASPGFEIAFALNNDIDINKTTFNLKMGVGATFGKVDVLIEYSYALKYQRMVYDITVPFYGTYRNTYLQIKTQIPLYRLR